VADTTDELKAELRKLGKRQNQIIDLMYGKDEPVKDFPNITISFDGLSVWYFDQPFPQRQNVRAALQKFEIARSKYFPQIRSNLADVRKHVTGRAVLAEIARARTLKLNISPYRPSRDGDHNATARGLSAKKSTLLGFKVRDSDGDPIPSVGEGTGEGSRANVSFSPEMWGPNGTSNITGPSTLPDEVLLHELVHACRQMNGVEHSSAVSGGYENEEEWVAIHVANIFMSEKKQREFCGSHGVDDRKIGKYVVGKKIPILPDPHRFLDNVQRISPPPTELLEKVRNRQRDMWNAIKDIPASSAAFNPIRDWEAKRPGVLIDL
jgi:hypothetical protein